MLIAALAASAASAEMVRIDVRKQGGSNYTFMLPENPVPDEYFEYGAVPGLGVFRIYDAQSTYPGSGSKLFGLSFGNIDYLVRLRIFDNDNEDETYLRFSNFPGTTPILFTGPIDNPRFRLGTFTYQQVQIPGVAYTDGGVVRITAVPEPATWLSIIGGFAIVGTALRRRRQARHPVAA